MRTPPRTKPALLCVMIRLPGGYRISYGIHTCVIDLHSLQEYCGRRSIVLSASAGRTTSALLAFRFFRTRAISFVLGASKLSSSRTMKSPAASLLESAEYSAARRIFLASQGCRLWGVGPKATPPPRHTVSRATETSATRAFLSPGFFAAARDSCSILDAVGTSPLRSEVYTHCLMHNRNIDLAHESSSFSSISPTGEPSRFITSILVMPDLLSHGYPCLRDSLISSMLFLGAGDGTFDQQQVPFRIHTHDFQVLNGNTFSTQTSRGFLPFKDTGRPFRAGAGRTTMALRTMASWGRDADSNA